MSNEIKMFGCTKAELIESVETELFGDDSKVRDAAMMAMSIMSDCQEQLVRGYTEEVRQGLNRAKFILSTYVR
jgi:hypothetical protein